MGCSCGVISYLLEPFGAPLCVLVSSLPTQHRAVALIPKSKSFQTYIPYILDSLIWCYCRELSTARIFALAA